MRLFVLGATGHIGQAVVRHALARGHKVTAATRQFDPPALRELDLKVVRVDPGFAELSRLAKGQDVLIDAAAPYPLEPCLAGSAQWNAAVNGAVERTERVIDAARSHRLRLVFVSSFTTLPRSESPLQAMESAWRRSTYPYFAAKAAMEQAVMAAAQQGLRAVIVNPAACLGPWEFRDAESSFVRLVLDRRPPMVMDQTLSVIDVRDVAEAIERALERELFGHPIALAGHNIGLVELAREIWALDGASGPPPVAIDSRMASIAAFWTSAAFAAFSRPAPSPWRAVPLIADSLPMHPSPEQIAMGLSPHQLAGTLLDAIAFHRSGRQIFHR